MHKWVKTLKLIEPESSKRIVLLNVSEVVLSEGANRDDLAVILNAVDHIAKSILLCEAING